MAWRQKEAASFRAVSCEMNVAASAPPLAAQAPAAPAAVGGATTAVPQATPACSAALWSPSDVPVRPPPVAQHPLHLLEAFLGTLEESDDDEQHNANANNGQEDDREERQPSAAVARRSRAADQTEAAKRTRRILRVADFLYGDTGSSRTVLDNALELLDGGYGAVRCYRAEPSGRLAYVVRGSRSGAAFAGGGGGGARSGDYLCFLHEMAGSDDNNNKGGGGGGGGGSGCFCPCRSFFERTKADRRAVCKHLLAARLGPYLRVGYEEYDVSDVQFAHIVLQHSFLPGG